MASFVGTTQFLVVLLLSAGAFVAELWALISVVKAPAAAFTLNGRLKKGAWLGINTAAALIGLIALPTPFQMLSFASILWLAALVAALVYLVSVRPSVTGRRRPPRNQPGQSAGW
ncbi:MAG: DUF2516 family protein [Bifidobacteriaceae bacterium]|nr:DUF2516 family protein [Bifidobacteriaceae bacterium]